MLGAYRFYLVDHDCFPLGVSISDDTRRGDRVRPGASDPKENDAEKKCARITMLKTSGKLKNPIDTSQCWLGAADVSLDSEVRIFECRLVR
ncbi:hypothetical protein TSACC_22803 [Terrimicrobium sacchariphilum]|uniref:Uncharacterized protein n=1 Tax=Terrimicrobium sacchariphilum TaxID=690879 RepID=A0A146GCW0_TERSA|nr:hypothetical protein TSACC_22803 [Terrimicrobium sacchariphilum]